MKDRRTLRLAALFLAAAALSPACDRVRPDAPNPNNPPELDLPGASFTLRVRDHERGFHPDSAYVFEGNWHDGHFWFGREGLDTMQLNIRPDNALVLELRSDDPAFAGVNAASSTRCIDIVPDGRDRATFHLEWVDEGRSEITLWNGDGAARREIRFTATSRREIPLEGIRIRLDGREEILATEVRRGGQMLIFDPASQRREYGLYIREFRGYTREDPDKHVCFEIAGPVPLNANTGTLHTTFDAVGLIDRGAIHEVLNNVWLKCYGLYDGNMALNPAFRWLHPFEMDSRKDDSWSRELLDINLRYWNNDAYTLLPQDLRERFAWVWPQAYCTSFTFSVAEGENIEKRNGFYWYDKVHQVNILFPDAPQIHWKVQ